MSSDSNSFKKVVIMGAASTGKTTLAQALAENYQTVWVAEYLRQFVDEKGAPPEENDVHTIAQGHLDLVSRMRSRANRVLFLDTDLFTTCVYQRIYFNKCPRYIEVSAKSHQSGLYLFTYPDIPWVPDPGQRSSPQKSELTHKLLRMEASEHSLNTFSIRGTGDERLRLAITAVDRYLSDGMSFTTRNPT